MKVRITKIEECTGGISICVQYHEPENHLRFFNAIDPKEDNTEYIKALEGFDANIKKFHIGDIIEFIQNNEVG